MGFSSLLKRSSGKHAEARSRGLCRSPALKRWANNHRTSSIESSRGTNSQMRLWHLTLTFAKLHRMTESQSLPINFGVSLKQSSPASNDSRNPGLAHRLRRHGFVRCGTGRGAEAIIDASRTWNSMNDEDGCRSFISWVFTRWRNLRPIEPPERMMASLYDRAKELLSSNKFRDDDRPREHSVSGPGHSRSCREVSKSFGPANRCSRDLRDTYDGTPHSHAIDHGPSG